MFRTVRHTEVRGLVSDLTVFQEAKSLSFLITLFTSMESKLFLPHVNYVFLL